MPKIRCPYCKSVNTGLFDGLRERERGYVRVRICNDCKRKFSTVEQYVNQCDTNENVELFCPFCGSKAQVYENNKTIRIQCVNRQCWSTVYFHGSDKQQAIHKYIQRQGG